MLVARCMPTTRICLMSRAARRVPAVALAVVSSVLVAVPAMAADGDPSVVDQTYTPMSAGEAVLIFAGIPIALALVVWLLVSAPGWTRGGRPGQADAWTGEPHVIGSGEERGPSVVAGDGVTELEPGTAGDDTGGTSARW
jgi:hypothetical protein